MNTREAHAILLASVMESDLLVKPEEIEAGRRILQRTAEKAGKSPADWGAAIAEHSNLPEAIERLKAQPEEFRANIVADLWEMSFADGEVHRDEKDFITRIADMLGVPALSKGSWPIPIAGEDD